MKREELDQNTELKNELMREIEEKAHESGDPLAAEIEVLKAHGIEFDEDALRAAAVEKMKLSQDEMDQVSGGFSDWCLADYSCYYVLMHSSEHIESHPEHGPTEREVCFSDWVCAFTFEDTY